MRARLAAAALAAALAPAPLPAGDGAGFRIEARGGPVSAETRALALRAGAEPRGLALVAREGGRELVRIEALDFPDGARVFTGWENRPVAPVGHSDIHPAEERALAEALDRHLPEGAVVLALPDLSRRLERLTRLRLPLARAAGTDLLHLPEGGAALLPAADPDPEAEALLHRLVAALAGPPGAAPLPEGAHLVLHLRDAFHVGLAAGGRPAVVLRAMPATGAHDGARQVRGWMRDEDHAAFAIERRAGGGLRVHFLADAEATETLVARLLPFNTARLGAVEGATLVYQRGGYWVYRLGPAEGGGSG